MKLPRMTSDRITAIGACVICATVAYLTNWPVAAYAFCSGLVCQELWRRGNDGPPPPSGPVCLA